MADGMDVSVVNISVVDKEGREVPDADNLIMFNLEGDAKIIGVGNGDPSGHEPDKAINGAWQRRLFNGKCQVLVQAGRTAGNSRFAAIAADVSQSTTEILLNFISLSKLTCTECRYGSKPRNVCVLNCSRENPE